MEGSAKKTRRAKQKPPKKSDRPVGWEQLERDLQGLKTLNLMQLDLIRNLEREFARLRRQRATKATRRT